MKKLSLKELEKIFFVGITKLPSSPFLSSLAPASDETERIDRSFNRLGDLIIPWRD